MHKKSLFTTFAVALATFSPLTAFAESALPTPKFDCKAFMAGTLPAPPNEEDTIKSMVVFKAVDPFGQTIELLALPTTVNALGTAQEKAKADGYEIRVSSAYRTWRAQAYGYCRSGSRNVAVPGTSTHETGHGVDVTLCKDGRSLTMMKHKRPGETITPDEVRLVSYMTAAGFTPHPRESFHFTIKQ